VTLGWVWQKKNVHVALILLNHLFSLSLFLDGMECYASVFFNTDIYRHAVPHGFLNPLALLSNHTD